VFLPDAASFKRVDRSTLTDPATVERLLAVVAALVRIFGLPNLCAIKISLPRPGTQGGLHDRDMHAGQQYVPLLGLAVPD
jgi:hypothetical protein